MPGDVGGTYRRGGVVRYIDKLKKSVVKNATTIPVIQTLAKLAVILHERVYETKYPPLSKVVERQKQLSNIPVISKRHTTRMPIAETIATNLPNHRQIIAPAFVQVCNLGHHGYPRPLCGRDTWARILDARNRRNEAVAATQYNRRERARHPNP